MTTVGDMISYSTTIDETKHGNSYLEFPELLWDFQKYFVTLLKTGLDTLRVQSVRGSKCLQNFIQVLQFFLNVSDLKSDPK